MSRLANLLGLAVVLSAMFSSALSAGTIVVGLPPLADTGNCVPFGCPGMLGSNAYYQQVYGSSVFPGSIVIDSVDFFGTQFPGGTPASGTFSLSLSYTSRALGQLSTTNPSDNISFGSQGFFTGSLPGLSGNVLALSGTPFLYDPSLGNLLLTITFSGVADNYMFLDLAESGSETTRAYFGGDVYGGGLGNDAGLVTGFEFESTAVPEPSLIILLGIGMGTVGLIGWRFKA
jgi:hypothetical protein